MAFTFTEANKCLILSCGLLVSAAVLHFSSVSYMNRITHEKFYNLRSADTSFLEASKALIPDTTLNLKCLSKQYEASQKIKTYYLDVATTFYRNYFAFSICSILFGTILAIAAFLVIQTGYGPSPLLLKTFFLTSIFIASFYFFLPTVLNNQGNYALNLTKAKSFNKIQLDILSFSSSKYINNADSLTTTIDKNFKEIATNFDLQTVEIYFDKMGGNPQEFFKSIKP